jgi:hypothetical protein
MTKSTSSDQISKRINILVTTSSDISKKGKYFDDENNILPYSEKRENILTDVEKDAKREKGEKVERRRIFAKSRTSAGELIFSDIPHLKQ